MSRIGHPETTCALPILRGIGLSDIRRQNCLVLVTFGMPQMQLNQVQMQIGPPQQGHTYNCISVQVYRIQVSLFLQ